MSDAPEETARDTGTAEPLLEAWNQALAPVLSLLDAHKRDLFRHEIHRFLATSRFDQESAARALAPMKEMLIEAARAARQPAAIHATRELDGPTELVALCEHLLAEWLGATDRASRGAQTPCAVDGMGGEVVFGERLGGPGRPGSASHPETAETRETTNENEGR